MVAEFGEGSGGFTRGKRDMGSGPLPPGLSFGSAFRQLAELFTELPNFLWQFRRAAEYP